ncbi:hypothetical protein KJ059_13185 [Myxococcota bacterium]|nr:hypothetical protein [Myxococcota bacterium]MCZ7620353.1 hypothetical protein [Myxococcota bacterium]
MTVVRVTKRFADKRGARLEARFIQMRRRQIAVLVPAGGALLLLGRSRDYLGEIGIGPTVFGIAFLLVIAAGFSWANWRCPACKTSLGMRLNPDRCPRCEKRFKAR